MIPSAQNSARWRARSGSVLVVTLALMALVMILLLVLLDGASEQSREAETNATLAREKMLADSAVALIIGQIQQASTQTGQAWISQPGLLRTYDAALPRVPTACYKLYSTATLADMIDTSGALNFLSNDVPTDWNASANQNLYTDLNTPAQTSGLPSQTIYPIFDPALTNVTEVSIDPGHAAEMPVAWLYELQDGTLGPASGGTSANPIVARLAFWTDDDTCKVNLNTAGDGTPWNTPRVNSTNDAAYSTNQPAPGQYPSYPGHPAMTSLAEIFGTNVFTNQQLLGMSPRYSSDGSSKMDRLYASIDELCFSTNQTSAAQRIANPPSAGQIVSSRFVLTVHSVAPETTLLGEPRIAIWPVADTNSVTSPKITATDEAITNVATVGAGTTNPRSYFFLRHNALSATDDLNTNIVPSNAQLFSELAARGNETLPGYGTTFAAKYPGANWTQIMLEITDYIRGINAIDPSPAPFVPYAAGDSSGVGRGFIVPLTTTYGSGTNQVTLRGLGRCPTLSGLTLVLYVSGFGFDSKTTPSYIDYEETPDTLAGTSWTNYFAPSSSYWQHVTSERVRAFLVPSTFQPGCGYPEVSDACDLALQGLNGIGMSSATANDFGFPSSLTAAPILGNPLIKLNADRAWGGNEGPITWRAIGDALANGATTNYPFASTKPYLVTMPATKPQYSASTGRLTWPTMPTLTFYGLNTLTVLIRDRNGNTLQTLHPAFPQVSFPAPTILNEYDHRDGATPATSTVSWSTNALDHVFPSYYMTLKNRLLATQNSRPFLIQPGDVTRGVEANDLRVVAALTNVPSGLFQTVTKYSNNIAQTHQLSFADGTSALGSIGPTQLVKYAPYAAATNSVTGLDWRDGKTAVTYSWYTNAPCSAPTGTTTSFVTMTNATLYGDWDTGPGFSPDGAQINLSDSGTTLAPVAAYFSLTGGQMGAATQRTPNALVPSPVIFGSLPAGINPLQPASSEPWRTLLFCPNPSANFCATPPTTVTSAMHPGFASPPDYLVLDNFWMPVIEPYAISTRLATASKINLNDQIAPFTWLHRSAALHALLHDLRLPTIPYAMASQYKTPGPGIASIWNPIDENATVTQIENRFAGNSVDAYLSESEICSVPLVPQGVTATALDSLWNGATGTCRLTGDNLRELPYAQIYGRLTTRSNAYTVHIRVQVLQKLRNDPQQNLWKEGTDLILGDWRGSCEIERYLDPTAAAPVAGQPLGPYKFRIVSMRRFAP